MFKINLEDGIFFSQSNSGQNVDFIVSLSIFKVEKTLNSNSNQTSGQPDVDHV